MRANRSKVSTLVVQTTGFSLATLLFIEISCRLFVTSEVLEFCTLVPLPASSHVGLMHKNLPKAKKCQLSLYES